HDWDPDRVHVEPLLQKAKAGATLKWTLVAANPLASKQTLKVALEGRGLTPDQKWELEVASGGTARREVATRLANAIAAGRHVFPLRVTGPAGPDASDAFVVVDVGP